MTLIEAISEKVSNSTGLSNAVEAIDELWSIITVGEIDRQRAVDLYDAIRNELLKVKK